MMTFGCGCREISRTPIEFKIESCPQVHINCGPLLPNTNDKDFDTLQRKIVCDFKKVIKLLECGILPDIEIILEEISLLFMNGCGYNVAKKMYSTDIEDDYFLRHDNFLSEFDTLEEKNQVLLNLGIYDKLQNMISKQEVNTIIDNTTTEINTEISNIVEEINKNLDTKIGFVVHIGKYYYGFATAVHYRLWLENLNDDLVIGKWIAGNYIPTEFTIVFNTGEEADLLNPITVIEGFSFIFPKPTWNNDPTQHFAGWYLNSSFEGEYYNAGDRIVPTFGMVFYAKWVREQKILTFYYNYNDLTETISSYLGETVNLYEELVRNGYIFNSWNTKQDGTGINYEAGDPYKIEDNQSFYALWSPISYTISFNGNGSTSGEMQDLVLTYDEEVSLTTNVFARTGYTFAGWDVLPNGDNVTYTDGQSIMNLTNVNSTITLYARWTPIVYNITYILNNGTFVTDKNNYTIESETITLDTPNRIGYTFQGWYDNINFIGLPITNIITGSTDNKIFYAKWQINTYFVTFIDRQTSTSIPADYGTLLRDIIPVVVEPMIGYEFNGWHINQNGTGNNIESVPDHNITLYALWEKCLYTVNFVDDYGNNTSYLTTVYYEETINDIPTYTRTGYTFVGWTENIFPDDFATSADVINLSSYLVRDNVTLHANWKSNVYNITFNPNFNNAQSTTILLNYGLIIMIESYLRPGYIFVEWNTSADGTGIRLENNTQATLDITYYALWEQANRYKLMTSLPQSNNIEWSNSDGLTITLGLLEGWNNWKGLEWQYIVFPDNGSTNPGDYFLHNDDDNFGNLQETYILETNNVPSGIIAFLWPDAENPLDTANESDKIIIK